MTKILAVLFCYFISFQSKAQFAGPVGSSTSDAIFKDSSIIISWASTCNIIRGKENISNQNAALSSYGSDVDAIGLADNTPVSLGDKGEALLTFSNPIKNGIGSDFAVFENSFSDNFLELAFVEVSSNGINFVRFPAMSNTPFLNQIGPFANIGDATKLYNLAGKYKANYGTPFDLQELVDSSAIDVNNITHIKIIDVVGQISGSFVSFDKNNHPINDPFPTEFASGGFDLDAVGVIHSTTSNFLKSNESAAKLIISDGFVRLSSYENISSTKIVNSIGQIVFESKINEPIDINWFPKGVYFLQIDTTSNVTSHKFVW